MVAKSKPKRAVGDAIEKQIENSRIDIPKSAAPIDLYLGDKHLLIEKFGNSYYVSESGIGTGPKKRGYIELEEGKEVVIGTGVKEATENLDLDGHEVARYHLKIRLNGDVFTLEDNSIDGTTVLYTE